MPEKLYRSNKVLQYILRCNENIRKDIFRESELKFISAEDFQSLINNHCFYETYQDIESVIYYDKDKTAYRVRQHGKDYVGYQISGEGNATVILDKADITFYMFNFFTIGRLFKNANDLIGMYCEITSRVRAVGKKDNIGFLLGFFKSDCTAEIELMALPTKLKHCSYFLVACPNFEIGEDLNNRLVDKGVFCLPFDKIVDENWIIDFGIVSAKKPDEGTGFIIPDLTDNEKKKYAKDYPRKDVIEFFNTTKGYFIKVNGHELELDRIPYGLLLLLSKSLKADNDGGKISVESAVNENIVRDAQHFYRVSGELNKLMKPFIENQKDKIVANIKKEGKYRLTTMPSRIKQPHTKWLNSRYNLVKKQIEQERQKRGVELNYKV